MPSDAHSASSAGLLGLAMVIDDANKGQRLVFRYPAQRELGPGSKPSPWDKWAAEFHQISPETFARLFRPKAPLCGKPFRLVIDRVHYLSYPVLLTTSAPATKEASKDDILLFNVIIATTGDAPASVPEPRDAKSGFWSGDGHAPVVHTKQAVQEVLARLAKALLHEQKRCRYVSKEVATLLQIRESVLGKDDRGGEDQQTMIDLMLEHSSLANDLKDVFHGLRDGQEISVTINSWIHLSLKDPLARVPTREELESISPYHTILLLVDEETILQRLPPDGSDQMVSVVQAANPLTTLEELSTATRIALPQLQLIAAHLVQWSFARVITTISLFNTYAVKPSGQMHAHSLDAMSFQQSFPSTSLFQVLSAFGAGITLRDLFRDLSEEGQALRLTQLVWLLQHDLIQELCAYITYLGSLGDPSELTSGTPLIKRLVAAGHLSGDMHITELLYRGDITRGELVDLMDSDDPCLVITLRPPPG